MMLTNHSLYSNLKEQERIIKDLILQINLLKDRIIYLEELFLPIPENHEILYEKIYNPMKKYPYDIDILESPSLIIPSSKLDGETS